jgi:hypothetical protein
MSARPAQVSAVQWLASWTSPWPSAATRMLNQAFAGAKAGDSRVHENDHAAGCLADLAGSRRRRMSRACGSDPRSVRRRSYAPRRTNASRPRRTVSVSVFAPEAYLASRNRRSSMCSVFFIHTIVPSLYGTAVVSPETHQDASPQHGHRTGSAPSTAPWSDVAAPSSPLQRPLWISRRRSERFDRVLVSAAAPH